MCTILNHIQHWILTQMSRTRRRPKRRQLLTPTPSLPNLSREMNWKYPFGRWSTREGILPRFCSDCCAAFFSYQNELVVAKPESELKPAEELELVDPDRNANDAHKRIQENDETKFKDLQSAVELDGEKNEPNDANDANDAIIEPNLINSLGENPDDEESVPLANNNKLPRFHARAMAKDVGDANLPDDQDTENDHDGEDDRGEK